MSDRSPTANRASDGSLPTAPGARTAQGGLVDRARLNDGGDEAKRDTAEPVNPATGETSLWNEAPLNALWAHYGAKGTDPDSPDPAGVASPARQS